MLLSRVQPGTSYVGTVLPGVIVFGLGLTLTVAPLTATVLAAADARYAGVASGVNNAVSRIAALLAVAVFGALLNTVFQSALDRQMDRAGLAPTVRADIDAQRSKLAAIETGDARGRRIVQESFIEGYRTVLWMAAGLAIASSLSAAVLISGERKRT